MKNISKLSLLSASLVAGLAFTNSASAIVVGGVDIGPAGSGFSILATQLYETQVTGTAQILSGVGQVTAVNANTSFFSGLPSGTQLNYIFQTTTTFFSATQTVFDGGFLRFYLDPAGTFINAINETNITGLPSAFNDVVTGLGTANGISNLWLDTTWTTVQAPTGFPTDGSLFGTGTNFSGNNFSGTGLGNLDVVGGIAGAILNSNFFDVILPGGAAAKADINVSSSFSLSNPAAGTALVPLTGTANFTARPTTVPEPMPIALIGLGLLAAALGKIKNRTI